MRRCALISLLLLSFSLALRGQYSALFPESPLRETRAVWVTTLYGLDWPRAKATDRSGRERQQAELCALLDDLQLAGINVVLLQTRVRSTLIYPSRLEPMDACLTGRAGQSPGYDALDFAIAECHKRGMQLHAWLVCCFDGNPHPADPRTADHLADIAGEIAQRYDVDGISLDYIRYPENKRSMGDSRFYRQRGAGQSLAAWRTANTERIVQVVHDRVKAIKPWLCLSASPVGKYADVARYRSGGWNARDAVYQDAAAWMSKGLIDCLFPMMYFRGNQFFPFAIDWQERACDSHVCPGLGVYMLDASQRDWPLADIIRQLHFMRSMRQGQCYFRARFLTEDTKGIFRYLRFSHNARLALPFEVQGGEAPEPVRSLSAECYSASEARLTWQSDAPLHNVYAITGGDTLLVRSSLTGGSFDFSPSVLLSGRVKLGVAAMNRYGNQSAITVLPTAHQ